MAVSPRAGDRQGASKVPEEMEIGNHRINPFGRDLKYHPVQAWRSSSPTLEYLKQIFNKDILSSTERRIIYVDTTDLTSLHVKVVWSITNHESWSGTQSEQQPSTSQPWNLHGIIFHARVTCRSETFNKNTDTDKVVNVFNHGILESYWNSARPLLLQLADVRHLVGFFTHWVLAPW